MDPIEKAPFPRPEGIPTKPKAATSPSLRAATERFEDLNLDFQSKRQVLGQLRSHAREIRNETEGSLMLRVASAIGFGENARKLNWIESQISKTEGELDHLSHDREHVEKVIQQMGRIRAASAFGATEKAPAKKIKSARVQTGKKETSASDLFGKTKGSKEA